jgi:hypothetical protein
MGTYSLPRKIRGLLRLTVLTGIPLLSKKLAVRTHPNELQHLCIRLAVDQQQVRFEVAFPVFVPFTGQTMVAILFGVVGY